MESTNRNRTLGFGFLIIIVGLAILLHQLDLLPPQIDNIFISWQMLLIVIGILNLFSTQSKVVGFILIAIGGFFLLPEMFDLPYNFKRTFWPILLILVGLFILFIGNRSFSNFQLRKKEIKGNTEYISEFNILSGSEKIVSIQNFKGGTVTSIFGGSKLDLSESTLSTEINVLEVFFLFGGSEIILPRDWNIINQVNSVLGGFSDKGATASASGSDETGKLIIKGTTIFGGGEIKRI